MIKPELLAPAGDMERLKMSVLYGADAVYLAGTSFGMRSFAGNFSPEELPQAVRFAHDHGVKVHVTVNTMPRGNELVGLPAHLEQLNEVGVDALIVADLGVFRMAEKYAPRCERHMSTQVSIANANCATAWYELGAKRVVLARELSLEEIRLIRQNIHPETELECFVHGAMCVSYSGRCLLSNYLTGRNANGGACAQPCRWKYHLREEKRSENLYAEEDPQGTYVFSSKDMRMIEHIGDLVEAGVDSFKIEGRMKSAYYTAAITNAYRMAIDDYFEGREFDVRCVKETENVSHREYGTGYFYSSPDTDANVVDANEYIADRPFLATVTSFDPEKGLAKCYQRNKMVKGMNANLLSPKSFGRDFIIGNMFDSDMNPIESTPHAGMEFYLEIDSAKSGDIIRG